MAAGSEALKSVKATEPMQWLAPSTELSEKARAALKNLYSSLRPFTPKSPFDELLVEGFDAEQIWQQIDIQSQPLISNLRRELKRYEKNPDEIKTLKVVVGGEEKVLEGLKEAEESDEELEEESDDEEEDGDVEENDEDEEEDEEEVKVEEEEEDDEEEGGGNNEIEDGFFSIKELGKYLKTTEAEEYENDKEEEEEDDDDEDEEEEDDDAQELMTLGEGEDDGEGKDARYEDFFGKKKLSTDVNDLSTHEKEQLKLKAEIEQREKAMMDPKTWTMQGEVTATKRPPNSALEVDIDFEHNVRPAPPITEEVTQAVEDMIRKRIEQELFDDVQRAPTLPTKAPRERKEMDEKKSEKGLAGEYEQEYLKINAISGPLSSKDKQKNEAEMLFKKLCLKLDALSHFHFTPKPVIEDMSIQDNVPAIAMEEIAPVAVSDAAMLAPEEVFSGKGDIKEEAELTQAERKRRRANKKRKFKAATAKKMTKKPRDSNKDSREAI